LRFLYPCNCSYDFSWGWRTYQTLGALKAASVAIVVAQVTSARTVGYNVSSDLAQFSNPPADLGLVPVTGYNITVTTVASGGANLLGTSFLVAEIGGTANGTTMSISGYPALSVGQSYVFFISIATCAPAGTSEIPDIYHAVYPPPTYFTSTTTGGPQGLFTLQGGNVYSLDITYPQADAWLPVKADGIPLAQFVAEVQAAAVPTNVSNSVTNSTSTSGIATTTPRC